MNGFYKYLAAVLLGCLALNAQAVVLSLSPSTQNVSPGDAVSVDLSISGLGTGASPSLGTFDVTVGFDTSVLSFVDAVFTDSLGSLAFFEAFAFFDDTVGPGLVELVNTSLLEADSATCILCFGPYLNDIQGSSFVLATLNFTAIAPGTSPLSLSGVLLGDENAQALVPDDVTGAAVTVIGAAVVPVPGTLLLVCLGMLGIGLGRYEA